MGTVLLPQPPYSPDIAPNDFFLVPKMKIVLKGKRFDNTEDIISESKNFLRGLTRDDFSTCFDIWRKRWIRCIDAQGDYFEKY